MSGESVRNASITVRVRKQLKDRLQHHATKSDESLSDFLNRALEGFSKILDEQEKGK